MGKRLKIEISKFSEQDSFVNGCIGDCTDHGVIHTIVAETLIEIKHRLESFLSHDLASFEAVEDDNFLEMQRLENADGEEPTKEQRAEWEAGRLDLYAATYRVYLSEIQSTALDAATLKGA